MRLVALLVTLLFTTQAYAVCKNFTDYGEGDVLVIKAHIALPGTAPATAVPLLSLRNVEENTVTSHLDLSLRNGQFVLDRSGIARSLIAPTSTVTMPRDQIIEVVWYVELSMDAVLTTVWANNTIVFQTTTETLLDIPAYIESGTEFKSCGYTDVVGNIVSSPQAIVANLSVTAL